MPVEFQEYWGCSWVKSFTFSYFIIELEFIFVKLEPSFLEMNLSSTNRSEIGPGDWVKVV